jgi:hypothetical protein
VSEVNAELDGVKAWLRTRLLELVNVQHCALTAGKTLIVHTWTGVVINVHLLDAPIKTRQVRGILQESTAVGIGVMFLLRASLAPSADERFEPKEWLLALHAINHERVYLYDRDPAGYKLLQAHFEPVGTTGQWAARYGPAVEIDQLRYFRTTVRPRYIKGDWQIADFGLNAFWRDPYSAKRTTYRRPDDRQTTWKAWSQTTWEGRPHEEDIPAPQRPLSPRGQLDLSYELLEVSRDATRDEIKASFRKLALAVHPDTSALPKSEAEEKFRLLNEAYEFIKATHGWT